MEAAFLFDASAMPDRDWWVALWPDPEGILRDIGIQAGMTVVDLCFGDGYFTAPLSKLVAGRVVGIDVDPAMLEKARAEMARTRAPECKLIQADAMKLDAVIPQPVDYVLLANTFHGVPDKSELVRRIRAVLKPDGQFAIINWHAKPREETVVLGKPRGPRSELRMSPEDTRQVVERGGLTFNRLLDLPPYHYASIFVRQ